MKQQIYHGREHRSGVRRQDIAPPLAHAWCVCLHKRKEEENFAQELTQGCYKVINLSQYQVDRRFLH